MCLGLGIVGNGRHGTLGVFSEPFLLHKTAASRQLAAPFPWLQSHISARPAKNLLSRITSVPEPQKSPMVRFRWSPEAVLDPTGVETTTPPQLCAFTVFVTVSGLCGGSGLGFGSGASIPVGTV